MRPPPAEGATLPVWPERSPGTPGELAPVRGRRPSRRRGRRIGARGKRMRLAALAAATLLAALAVAGYAGMARRASGPAAPAAASPGTAFLGTASCASWRAADARRRQAIIQALGTAATQPDPENPGATLSAAAAYGLYARVCASPSSRSLLLYEAYNRAASMRAAGVASGVSVPLAHP